MRLSEEFRRFSAEGRVLALISLSLLCDAQTVPPGRTAEGLKFTLGDKGLQSLSYNGRELVVSPDKGELQFHKSVSGDTSATPVSIVKASTDKLNFVFSWGSASCVYVNDGDKLQGRINISNSSAAPVTHLTARLMYLTFPIPPLGNTLEAGPFAYGASGKMGPLYRWPREVSPDYTLPIIRIDYGDGAINYCSDDLVASVGVGCQTDSPNQTTFPLIIHFPDIKPGDSKAFSVSLRFGGGGALVQQLSGDILKKYGTRYPFQVAWTDHRSIGAIFLASAGINVPTNPRRWIMNSGKLDVTTDKGKSAFRDALLQLADRSIHTLKDADAQGMITWDPEGEEFTGHAITVIHGFVRVLAPEMEFKADGRTSAIDEYFQKFRAAGLKVGLCIRPEQVTIVNGRPKHQEAMDDSAAQILEEKIAYARKRWGCTLFYVDSTGNSRGVLNPDVFKTVADAYPDVLLMPESESLRYFAYSAPFNSYVHHKVTSTPFGARLTYPRSFSVLLAPDGDRPEDHDALVTAVKHGDILIFNGWYPNRGAEKIKKIYEEAASKG